LLVLGGQGWAFAANSLSASLPAQIFLPQVPGWQRIDYKPEVWWEPRAAGADHRLLGRYADSQGRTVDVFMALYSSQAEGREATGFGEGALPPDSEWAWTGAGAPVTGAKVDRLRGQGRVERLALTYYRNGELLTGSAARLKLATIADRLLLRREPTALLILSAEPRTGEDPHQTLRAFRQSTGAIGPWMDRIATLR
jgi:EpsI family protein